MSLSQVQLLQWSTVACWILGGVHVGVGQRVGAWLAVGEDRRLARRVEAELAGMGDRALPARVAVLLAQVARAGVLEDGGVLLLLLFVFGVKVLKEILCSHLLARLVNVFRRKSATRALNSLDAQMI